MGISIESGYPLNTIVVPSAGSLPALGILSAPLFFMRSKKHWLTFETEGDHMALRLDKKNFEYILIAVESKSDLDIDRIIEE